MPDGTSRFSIGKDKIHHYMSCSSFSNFTVLPEIALAKVNPDAPFDKICYIGCGVTTGVGAVTNTAKVEIGATASSSVSAASASDLLLYRNGGFLFVEVKSSSDKLSAEQMLWIADNHALLQLPFRLAKLSSVAASTSAIIPPGCIARLRSPI